MVFRILPPEFRAKARAEGPRGNRALHFPLHPRAPPDQNPEASHFGLSSAILCMNRGSSLSPRRK